MINLFLSKYGLSKDIVESSCLKIKPGIYLEIEGIGIINDNDIDVGKCVFSEGQIIKIHKVEEKESKTIANLRKENDILFYKVDDNVTEVMTNIDVVTVINELLYENKIVLNKKKLIINISYIEYSMESRDKKSKKKGEFDDYDLAFDDIKSPVCKMCEKCFENYDEALVKINELLKSESLDSVQVKQNGVVAVELRDIRSSPKCKVASYGSIVNKFIEIYNKRRRTERV